MIKFINTDGIDDVIVIRVKNLYVFDSFAELYNSLPLLQCEYTEKDIDKALPTDMEQYYPKEKQRLYGVVGIEMEII